MTKSQGAEHNKSIEAPGQGYLGLPLVMAAVDAGWQVVETKKSSKRVVKLNSGFNPVVGVLAQIGINSPDCQEESAAMSQTFG